jgi:hypothetical protein
MTERLAVQFESTGARARALLGGGASGSGNGSHESAGAQGGLPGERDAARLARRIAVDTAVAALAPDAPMRIAEELVRQAAAAMDKLMASNDDRTLTDADVVALESVISVRGRPAVRVLGGRLDSLAQHPGSDIWQEYITDYETAIVRAASATGAVMVTAAETRGQPWLQGSAWLVRPNRVVTNRHVVLPPPGLGVPIVEADGTGGWRVRRSIAVSVTFDADGRPNARQIQRRISKSVFVAESTDPVDIAVLEIEPRDDCRPLRLQPDEDGAPSNLFVVGHPGLTQQVAAEVRAVFGNPDGHKRVSFGKRLRAARTGILAHDASTVGGYSGAPVLNIKGEAVAGLHYYGDPVNGNLAVASGALRAHAAAAHFGSD